MDQTICAVRASFEWLEEKLSSGEIQHPRCRQLISEMLDMIQDVAQGQAGDEHLSGIRALSRKLKRQEELEPGCQQLGQEMEDFLNQHLEVFLSHIQTHICPQGHCRKLTPSPCQMACPAGIDIPSYLTLIGEGKYAEAIDLIRKDNPFPWVCGLVCTHPCEFMCVRARVDQPISIMSMKGFAAERALSAGQYQNPEKAEPNGNKVCIVGAGPGGLTAAYYLALRGYQVCIIEALPFGGGMMMTGIPRYRLPREVIDREVDMIQELGVEFRFNTRLGQDISYSQLREEGFQAFIVAIGAHECYSLGLPGEELYPQIIPAIYLLRRVALGDHTRPGRKVAVIGGGNVAIDAARTCLRLGCREVSVVYRRTHSEMPAHGTEVVQAEEEGIQFLFLTVPKEIMAQGKDVQGLKCLRAELSEPDADGRQKPVPIEGSDHVLDVDTIIPAIGQVCDTSCLEDFSEMTCTRRNTIHVHTASMQTDQEGVFAVGDAVTGPATVVEAIGGGKKAAAAVHRYFLGLPQPKMPPVPVRRNYLEPLQIQANLKMDLQRPRMPLLNTDRRRITFQQVELGLSVEQVKQEAPRCLRCDICIRCGTCVRICRDMGISALQLGYLDFDQPGPTDFKVTAERCIGCGACANNCPTTAMQIKDQDGERILSLCGTILNRLKLEYCASCGKVLGPGKYLDYISKRMQGELTRVEGKNYCMQCARELTGIQHSDSTPPSS
ncbi:MAG: FAD-dependent oxidoreductase [Desulfohalobiaceae bacterium]